MNTLKTLGGAVLAIVIKLASDIAASLLASGLVLLNAPEWICMAAYSLIYIAAALLLVKLVFGKMFKFRLEELGLSKFSLKPVYVVLAVLLPAAVCGIYLLFVKGSYVPSEMDAGQKASALVSGVFYTAIAAAVVEEALFRGVLMNLLKKRWNTAVGVLVPSVLFGAVHIMEMENPNVLDCVQVVAAGALAGILFSLIAIKTGSVWNSMIVHSIWNLVIAGNILSIGAEPSESALVTYVLDSKSFAVTGGAFGIEASVIAVIAYVLALLPVLLSCRTQTAGDSAVLQNS